MDNSGLCFFRIPLHYELLYLTPPPRGISGYICIYLIRLIFLETRIIGLHFAADIIGLSALKFLRWAPENYTISARVTFPMLGSI